MDTNDTQTTIRITVRAFANIKQVLGQPEATLELPEGTSIQEFLVILEEQFPAIKDFLGHIIVAVNREYAKKDRLLVDGDKVAIFPPVSGGSASSPTGLVSAGAPGGGGEDRFTYAGITEKPIDSKKLLDQVTEASAGAVVTFFGVVRDNNLGRRVDYLEYEAYEEMAVEALNKVASQARERWPLIRRVAIEHRVGHLDLGELAVVVAVGAPHRNDGAFEAARFIIDRIKEIVPIWKKEGWSGGEEWLEGDYTPKPGE